MLLGDEQIFERGVCSRVCVWRTGVITTPVLHYVSDTRCVLTRNIVEGEIVLTNVGVQTSHWCLACFFNRQLVNCMGGGTG